MTFLLGWGRAGLGVVGAGFTTLGLCVRGAGEGALRGAGARRLSMSLLLGTRLQEGGGMTVVMKQMRPSLENPQNIRDLLRVRSSSDCMFSSFFISFYL